MGTIIVVGIILLIGGIIFLQGLIKIQASPPFKGQLTKWGKRIEGEVRDEGFCWLFLRGFYKDIIPVNVKRHRFELIVKRARTPDRSESEIPISITFRACQEHFIQYIDSGEEEGAEEQLSGELRERVREWCMGKEEGPANWIELNQSQLEGSSILIKKIAGVSLSEIPPWAQEAPSWIWFRYFSKTRPEKFLENEKSWAKNEWEKIRNIIKKFNTASGETEERLKEAVEKRKKEIEAIRAGDGKVIIKNLGIVLELLNVGEINVLGTVAEEAENEAKEEQQRKGEALEIKYVLQRIKQFMKPPFNYSPEQALEIVQTERGKVVKNIQENKFNISPETRQMFEETFSSTILGLFKFFKKDKGD